MRSLVWDRLWTSIQQNHEQTTRRRMAKSRRRRPRRPFVSESLEPRVVLDARMVITEIVASNGQGLEDEDDNRVDWIELFNAGDTAANLSGWHLTDDAKDKTKWTFPDVTVQPDEYLVVFASGKDRHVAGAPLHTNFSLSAGGEYLALTDGAASIVSQYAPEYPPLLVDRSFGLPQDIRTLTLIDSTTESRALVPSVANGGDLLGTSWTDVAFDDSAWKTGVGGVGFEASSTPTINFDEHLGLDIETEMLGINSTALIRMPFTVDNPAAVLSVQLGLKYDDGYVLYLNGVEVGRENTPTGEITWNSEAQRTHRDTLAIVYEPSDLTPFKHLLREGKNVLAIHGLNSTPTSDDFLMAAELTVNVPAPLEAVAPRYFQQPSPGAPNGLVTYAGLVEPVTTSVERGFFDEAFDVVITSSTPGAKLVYTTDGSTPSLENGTVISPDSPLLGTTTTINVSHTTTLRAAAFKDDFLTSAVNTQTYLMLSDVITQDVQATLDAGFPEKWRLVEPDYGVDPDVVGPDDKYEGRYASQIVDALKAAPTVSIVTDIGNLFDYDTGIYVNSSRSGFDWERPMSFEFIQPGESPDFQADGGIRIAGDNVRSFSNSKKQSMRLEFRGEYGPTKLRFPVFGEDATDSFDTLILRGGYNDAWVHTPDTTQYIRDTWARTTLLEMGNPQAHGQFVHVYLNGIYWGLYNMVERPNHSFSAAYFGGDKDEWDALNTGRVRNGTDDAWGEMRRVASDVENADPSISNAAYQKLLGKNPDGTDNPEYEVLLDVNNYIDYLIVNFYGGNTDWPGRNFYVGRQQGPDSTGFKSYAWDTEKILDHGEGSNLNTNRTGVSDGVAQAYKYLRANEEFRLLFADHVQKHFFDGGALYVDPENPQWDVNHPERNMPAARYNELALAVEQPLIGESARWGDTTRANVPGGDDGITYTQAEWQRMRDSLFLNYFPQRSAIVLQQFVDAGLYPDLAAPVFNQHGGPIQAGFELTADAPGQIYYTLDGSDPRRSALEPGSDGPGIADSALLYSGPVVLNGAVVVKARTYVDGQWSALNEASFTLATPPIRVSELMYHPRDPAAGSSLDAEDFEFIEVVNISKTDTVNLEGVAFTAGIQFVFPNMSLAPGQQIVVARNTSAYKQRYGTGTNLAGQYGGTAEDYKLSNSGEMLQLVDRFGTVIQEFTYRDDWVPSTDGGGHSLVIVDALADVQQWNEPSQWRASLGLDGSPGRAEMVDFTGDGLMDVQDIDAFCQGRSSGDLRFDLTGDGHVDDLDLTMLIEDLFGTNFGDANLDGTFDSRDFLQVLTEGEFEDGIPGNSTWADGDWNCDGEFTTEDLIAALASGAYVRGAQPAATSASRLSSADTAAAVADVVRSPNATLVLSDKEARRELKGARAPEKSSATETPPRHVQDAVFAEDLFG